MSHDLWDPSINPPISPSGEFIGDYQGLVADDCMAMPFVNDTHLANDPSRDPDFDHGLPRSPYQQIVTWRVPNRGEFGGVSGHRAQRRACRGRDHGKGRGYAKLSGRPKGANRAVEASPSKQAVRKARTRVGTRAGAGYRVHGP